MQRPGFGWRASNPRLFVVGSCVCLKSGQKIKNGTTGTIATTEPHSDRGIWVHIAGGIVLVPHGKLNQARASEI